MAEVIDLGSVHPRDLDSRATGHAVRLRMEPGRVYRIRHVEGVTEGTPEGICTVLARCGFAAIVAAETPDGREVRYEGGRFAVRPEGDNDGIRVTTLAEALEACEDPAKGRG